MKKDIYLKELVGLKRLMLSLPNTPFTMFAKVVTLVTMNMRYERVAFDKKLDTHPYLLTKRIVDEAITQFGALSECVFIESGNKELKAKKSGVKEEKHQELFNEMWDRYDDNAFKEYVDRYEHRIAVNGLDDLIRDKRCVDLGCGNGAFAFALLERGAAFAVGIDFGDKSVQYAMRYAAKKNLSERCLFRTATVYETGLKDGEFDFAIQNGVFHHLEDEDRAIREAVRILKEGGYFWYYTDGEGGISYDLWDTSVEILKDVPVLYIEDVLISMNVSRNKIVHITDGLSATYAHTSWDEITARLARHGFGDFRRLTGGFPTDFDLDAIEADPYGREKFGEGDLRVFCRLLNK